MNKIIANQGTPCKTFSPCLSAALDYASRGWRVHPLAGKEAVLMEWPTIASTDPATITGWWAQYPAANVGIVTGARSNLFVLDVDPDKGGDDALRGLETLHAPLPQTVEVITGRGGRHFYFEYPGPGARNSASKLGPGLDIRGEGGYVAAPASIHPDTGRTYEWEGSRHPDEVPLAPAPQWLLDKLAAPPATTRTAKSGGSIPNGQRNDALTQEAGKLRHVGMSEAAMEAALHVVNDERCTPPLDRADVSKIAHSVARYESGEPDGRKQAPDLSKALLSYKDLLALEIPERPRYLPWLFERSNVMVYGPRGVGKTYFQLALAVALTTGKPLWEWDCPKPVGVLYVDGEMPLDDLRKRTSALMVTPPIAPLKFLTGQLVYERCGGKDLVLASEEMRHEIVKILEAHPAIRVLILDNISCLFSGINEDSKQDWEPNNAWLIQLRHRGITTVLVHHAGKGGQQRGTSGREDSLDTVIQLAKPAGHDPREGCHFELRFTKCRSVTGDAVADLDVKLQTVKEGLSDEHQQWAWKPLEVSMQDKARLLVAEGVQGPTNLGEELGITKGYASKILKKLKEEAA